MNINFTNRKYISGVILFEETLYQKTSQGIFFPELLIQKEIIPGIKVFTGSRHTFNSQFVLVETGTNKVILASDNIWVYYSLEHLCPPSPGGTFDTTAYVRSMQRMKTLVTNPRYIIPGHDARIFSLFPKITEGVVKIE